MTFDWSFSNFDFKYLHKKKLQNNLTFRYYKNIFCGMKNRMLKIVAVFLISAFAFAGAYLDFFHASSDGSNVKLEWKTGEENNLKSFVIERRNPQSSFIEIATISPKGDYSYYSYIDESAYKTKDLIFIYRLRIVDQNQAKSYSSEVSVSQSVSGVKRTWGSIKAMFR